MEWNDLSIVKMGLSIYVSFLCMNIKANYVAQRFKSRSMVIFRHETALLQKTKLIRMGDVLLISEYVTIGTAKGAVNCQWRTALIFRRYF